MANTQNAGNDRRNQGQGNQGSQSDLQREQGTRQNVGNQSGNQGQRSQDETRRDDQGRQGSQSGSQGNQNVGNTQEDMNRQREGERGSERTPGSSGSGNAGQDDTGAGRK
jgi:hypothetical protein